MLRRIYHSLPLHIPLFLVLAPVLSFVILFSASSRAASQQDVSSHLLLQAISCLWLSIHNSMVSCILPSPIYTWCHALFNAYCMVFCILHCPVLTYLSLTMFADPHADNAIHYVAPLVVHDACTAVHMCTLEYLELLLCVCLEMHVSLLSAPLAPLSHGGNGGRGRTEFPRRGL